jgi:hypothetical protein
MVNWHGTRGHGPFVLKVLPETYLALSKAEQGREISDR